jgi:hypothetical protein
MTLQTYGPPTAAPLATRPVPLLVPFAPRRGWALADTGRRTAAVLALPLVLLVSLLTLAESSSDLSHAVLISWVLLGPTTFYSLARVLRPEPRSAERTPRHLLSGTATAFAVPTLVDQLLVQGDGAVMIGFGCPAAVLGALTLAWGLVALLVRAAGRR